MKEAITYNYGVKKTVSIEFPNICPKCHIAIKPEEVFSMNYENSKRIKNATILYKCTACREPFIVKYYVNPSFEPVKTLEIGPGDKINKRFSECVKSISPKFCEIYNQANIAEQENLNEVSGIGYRKALEFLIKDYVISENPEDAEKIQKMQLAQCIKTYIDDIDIKTLAERATWMGNDEAHFLKLYGEYDTEEKIKKFIDAITYFIEKKNVVREAENIEAKK